MKVALQTISWGRDLSDGGVQMLKAIRKAGYDGVELAQHPKVFKSATQLYSLLKGSGTKRDHLKLVGLAGGSLKERGVFLGELIEAQNLALLKEKGPLDRIVRFDKYYSYIYIDDWEKEVCKELMLNHYTLALHPHMFKPIQNVKEAEKLLNEYSELCFLPDTAHLTVAGEDLEKIIILHLNRIVAIHLKDWTSVFGRSYQFYSRGFGIEYGYGDVHLDKIVRLLKSRKFRGWLIVEQDIVDNPFEAALSCRNWLKKFGI